MRPSNNDLDIQIEIEADGRKTLTLDIGVGIVRAVEIPSQSLADEELALIQLARDAYGRMWGGDQAVKTIEHDPFDGLKPNDTYQSYHYIGQVAIPGVERRIITMRKVNIKAADLLDSGEEPAPPEDAAFWALHNRQTGERIPLWRRLRDRVASPAEIAAISRTGTYPYRRPGQTPLEKERNAIAFAAIQVLATLNNPHTYIICQLCPEFQQRVHSIDDGHGQRVSLDFARTEKTLGLEPAWQVRLDNHHPGVQAMKTFYPGYWIDGPSAGRIIDQLYEAKQLTDGDLNLAWQAVPAAVTAGLKSQLDDIYQFTAFFAQPKHFKYLIPLLKRHHQLRHKLIHEAADRPYSSTLIPELWQESALHLLRTAQKKYRPAALPHDSRPAYDSTLTTAL